MICPRCGQDRAHRSHRAGIKDYVYRVFQLIPYRCHSCNDRFYASRSGEKAARIRTAEERKIVELRRKLAWRRRKLQILTYTAAAAALLVVLYVMMRQQVQ